MFGRLNTSSRSWIATACIAMGTGGMMALAAPENAPTTQSSPATQPAPTMNLTDAQAAKLKSLQSQYKVRRKQFDDVVGDGKSLRDPNGRAATLSQLSPIWRDLESLEHQIREIRPLPAALATQPASFRAEVEAYADWECKMPLIAAGDREIIDQASAQAASNLRGEADIGKFKLLAGEWLSDPDEAALLQTQERIAAFLKTADVNDRVLPMLLAYFVDPLPTMTTAEIQATTAAREKLACIVKANYASSKLTEYLAFIERQKNDSLILAALGNKPLTLTGRTVDGKPFSTAKWRGKVILVDFWASWCGPCKKELPRVKAMYQKYHEQGLEVLGVSNDYKKDTLEEYLTANPGLAWPCLFDEAAAEDHQWNPLTKKCGIDGIPVMMLIDRTGICRTVEAGQNMETMIPRLLAEPEQANSGTAEPSKTAAN